MPKSPLRARKNLRARKSLRIALAGPLLGLFGVLAVCFSAAPTAAAAPSTYLNFQARLMKANGAIVQDGNYDVQFKIYDAASGGTLWWTETRDYNGGSPDNRVRVVDGYLTVNLGSVNGFPANMPWNQQLWLTMNIGGTGTTDSWDGEMSPRILLTAIPHAFTADQIQNSAGSTLLTTSGNQISLPNATGSSSALTFGGDSTADLYRSASGTLKTDGNFNVAGNISGSGTINLTGTGTSSLMGSLGIGVVNPQGALTIANSAWINAVNAGGTGNVNILQVNSNNQIQLGAALAIDGGIVLPTDAGQVTFSDLPVDSSATANTPESYTMRVGSTNALTVYGESDGAGGVQNVRIAIGSSITPGYTLDVGGDVNTSGVYRVGGVQICSSSGCTPDATSNSFIQNQTSANQSASFRISGTGQITNSGNQLTLSGDASHNLYFSDKTNGDAAVTGYTGALYFGNYSTNNSLRVGSSGGTIINTASASAFQVQNTSNATILGVDTTNGRVGVNTTSPTGTLSVEGSIYSEGGLTNNLVLDPQFANLSTYWSFIGGGAGTSQVNVTLPNGDIVNALDANETNANLQAINDYVPVNPYKTYRFTLWTNQSNTDSSIYFGMNAYNSSKTQVSTYNSAGTGSSNYYFWSGSDITPSGTWKKLTGYLLPCNTANSWANPPDTSSANYRMDCTTSFVKIRFLNYDGSGYGSGTGTDAKFALPSIEEVQSTNQAFSLNGSDYIINPQSGSVGVGTTAPGYKLTVSDNTNSSYQLSLYDSGGSSKSFNIGADTNGFGRLNAYAGLGLDTNGTEIARVNANGLGIGTSNINAKLQVVGGTTTIPGLGSIGGTSILSNTDANYGLLSGVLSNGNAWMQAQRVDSTATAYNLLLQPNGGSVAINTTNPGTYQLNVNGSANATTVYQNGNQVCDTSGNCVGTGGSGGIGGSGTANTIALFTGSGYTIGNSILMQSGTTVTSSGYLSATSGLQVGGTTRVDSSGNIINVANITSTGNVVLTNGGVNAYGYQTTNTSNTYSGQWTLLGTCTITSQYQDCHSQIEVVNVGDGSQSNYHANVDFRVKQQTAMGGQPYVELEASDLRSITADQFEAVMTQNDASATVVGLYMKVNASYQVMAFNPLINTSGSGYSHQVQWLSGQGYSASLPAGVGSPSQFAATYSNAILGTVSLQPAADAANVLQVTNVAGSSIFSVDTSASNGNIVSESDMESSSLVTADWANKGTSTVSQTTSQYYQGTHSAQAVITAASSGLQTGAFTSSIQPSTQYQLTFYARCSAAISTFTYGRQDVSGTDINATTTSSCSNSGWNYYTWHFTTGATITSPNIYMTMGTATSGTLYIDAVSLIQTTTSAFQPYENGAIQVNGVINTPTIIMPTSNSTVAFQVANAAGTTQNFTVDTLNNRIKIGSISDYGANLNVSGTDIFRNTSNSTTGFQVQNSSGVPIFDVDTSTSLSGNKITNYGFEVNTSGWSNIAGGTLTRQTTITNAYHGQASGQIVTTAANGGARTNSFTATVGAGTYTLSFYAKLSSGTFTTLAAGYNQGASDVACTLNSNTVLTTGFQRYVCTFTTTANLSSVWIEQTDATGRTFYIDAVQLVAGSSATPYAANGAIQLRGAVATPTDFQNYTDSTTAFQIQNAAGTSNLFVADTLNNVVGIGQTPVSSGSTLQVNGSISATSTIGFTNTGNAIQAITLNEVVTSSVNAGDVVVIDTGTAGHVTDATTANSTQVFGIATTTNAGTNVAQPIAVSGVYQVNVTGTVNPGNYLVTTTTAGVATASLAPTGGVIGQALSTNSGGKAWVLINPGAAGSNSLGTNGTTSVYESNVINDSNRAAALQTGGQGDGRDPLDSSTGIWDGEVNVVTNGGLESNLNGGYSGWQANGSGASVTRSTSVSKFGSASVMVTTDGTTGFRGASYIQNSNITAGNTYTVSAWVYSPSDTTSMQLNVYRKTAVGGSVTGQSSTNFNLTNQWQRVTLTFTAEASTTDAEIEVRTNGTQPANTFYVDGLQVEQSKVATPYIETNGSTALRNNSYVTAPASLSNATQGWFATRLRMGWASASPPNTYDNIFSWGDNGNSEIQIYFNGTNLKIERYSSSGNGTEVSKTVSFNAGDYITVAAYWNSTSLGISFNGSSFTTGGNTYIPSLASNVLQIGGASTFNPVLKAIDGDVMWAAAGTGTLVDADASVLNAYGNSDPSLGGLSTLNAGASTPTMAWSAEDVYINQGGSGLQGGSGSYIQNTTSLQTGNINLQSGNAGVPAAIFRGAVGQTANVLEVQDSSGNKLLTVDASGNLTATGTIGFSNSGNANQALTINEPITGSVTAGDVVVIDTANAGYVTDSTTANSTKVVGIATKTQTGGSEPIVISGIYQVNVGSNAPNIGDYLVTDGTNPGEASSTTSPSGGIVGQVMSTATSNKVWALIKPQSGAGGSSGSSNNYGLMESDFTDTGATVSYLSMNQSATIGNTIYFFGGLDSGAVATNKIYSAPVSNPTNVTYTGYNLPNYVRQSSLAIVGSNIYLYGGIDNTGTTINSIYSASVSNPASSWTTAGSLPAGLNLNQSSLAVIGNYVYLFGGISGSGSTYTNEIYRAPISNPTNMIDASATIPVALRQSRVAVIGNYVYLFGGFNSSNTPVNAIYRAPISNPLNWTTTTGSFPSTTGVGGTSLAIIGNYIYLINGYTNSGYTNFIWRAPVGNPVNGWTDTLSKLPGTLATQGAIQIAGNAIYIYGGSNGTNYVGNIYSAPIYNGSPDVSSNPSWITDSNYSSGGGSGTSSQTGNKNYELAYGENSTTTISTTATSEAGAVNIVNSSSYTYDGTTPVMVNFFASGSYNTAASNNVFELFEDSTDLGRFGTTANAAANDYKPLFFSRRITPSAGSHTFYVKLWVGGGTGYVLVGNAQGPGNYQPAYVRVTLANPYLQGGSGIANGTTTQTANFNIQSASGNNPTAIIQGASSQSADILDVRDASNTNLLAVDASGNLTVKGTIGFANQGNANQGITLSMKVTSAVNAGDVVVIDTSNAGQVTDSTTANSTQVVGIATQTKGAGQYQPIVISGIYQVDVGANTPSIGSYLVTDGNTGEAMGTSSPSGGIVGQVTSTASSNKVWALIKPQSGAGGGSGGGGGLTKLYDQTLSSAASSFDISNIPSGYDSIEGELVANNDTASQGFADIRLNGLTTGYFYQYAWDANATHSASDSATGTSAAGLLGVLPRSSGNFTDIKFTIPNYAAGASQGTHIESQFGSMNNNADGALYTGTVSNVIHTSAVNHVTVLPDTGNFAVGSRLILYGVGGSGIGGSGSGGGGVVGVQTYTSGSGTFNLPAGVTSLKVEIVGGGGGGGLGNNYGGGAGGAAGGYVSKFISSPSASYSYAVGAGGVPWGGGTHTNGGTTTFGSLTATGGSDGGGGSQPTTSTGGTGSGGDINLTGGSGTSPVSNYYGASGGEGGASYFGGGGSRGNFGNNGAAGVAYGSGGGGAGGIASSSLSGGSGAGGVVVITEYGTSLQGSGSSIQNGTSLQTNANFNIQSASANSVTATIHGAIGQSADILDVQNASNVNLLSVDPNGNTFVAGDLNVGGTIGFSNIGNQNQGISLNMVVSSTINANDVVVIDPTAAGQVTQSTTANSTKVFGIATQTNGTAGLSQPIVVSGIYQVNVDSAQVNIGDYLVTSNTAGRAMDSTSPSGGVIGQALSYKAAGSNGTVWARINPGNGAGGSGTGGAGYGLMESDWTDTNSALPSGAVIEGASVATIGNTIYMFGGSSGSTPVNTIYSAPVSDPTNWGSSSVGTIAPATNGLSSSQLAIIGNYIYLFGGNTSAGNTSTIYSAPVSNPTSWSPVGNLPTAMSLSSLAIVGSNIYLFGGLTASGPTNNIYSASIGNPTSWGSGAVGTIAPATNGLAQSSLAVIGNYIYLFGGNDASIGQHQTIYRAPVSSPLSWSDTGAVIPGPLARASLSIIGNYIYLFGGYGASAPVKTIYKASINNPVKGWSDTGSTLPSNLAYTTPVIAGNAVYLFGGRVSGTSTDTGEIYSAPIFNGSPNVSSNPSWITDSNSSSGGSGTSSQTGNNSSEAAYSEFTSGVSITAVAEGSAQNIVSAPSLTFDGNSSYLIQFYAPYITNSTSATNTYWVLYDGSVPAGSGGYMGVTGEVTANYATGPVFIQKRITPSAGAHTYSIHAYVSGGTTTVASGAGGTGVVQPGYIRITLANPQIQGGSGIANGTTTQTANFNIQSANANNPTAVIQGAASQSADILDVRNSSGSNLLSVDASGNLGVTGAIGFNNSGNANQIFTVNEKVTTTVNQYDVVAIDTNNAGQVTTTTLANSTKVFGVATQTKGTAGQTEPIAISGIYQVNVDTAAVNIGDYLVTSGTAGLATDSASPSGGVIGQAMSAKTAGSNGTVWVRLNPGNGAGGSGSGAGYGLMESDFTQAATLSMDLSESSVATIGNTIYAFGGASSFSSTCTNTIYSASVSSPSSWASAGSIAPATGGLCGSSVAIIGSKVYLFGGSTTSGFSNTIYSADVSTPTTWTAVGSIAPATQGWALSSLAIIGSYVYMFGGNTSGGGSAAILRASVGDPLTWSNVGNIINSGNTLLGSQTAVIGNYVYLFGGLSGSTYKNNIYRAPISNPLSWSDTNFILPAAMTGSQVSVIGNYIYLLGGQPGGTTTKNILRASTNNPLVWTTLSTTLPGPETYGSSYIAGNALYLLGGAQANGVGATANTVYSAPIYNGSPDLSSNPSWKVDSNASSGGGSGASSQTTNNKYELAYSEIPAGSVSVSTTGPSGTGYTNLVTAQTITTDGNTPIMINFYAPVMQTPSNAALYFYVFDGSTMINQMGDFYTFNNGTGLNSPVNVSYRYTPSAGSHTYSIQSFILGSTSTVYSGGSYAPAYIRITLANPNIQGGSAGIQNSTLIQTGNINLQSSSQNNTTLTLSGASGQSADILDVKNSSGSLLFNVASSGYVGVGVSNPQAYLDVNASLRVASGGNSYVKIYGGSDGSSSSAIYLYNPAGSLGTQITDGTYTSTIGGALTVAGNLTINGALVTPNSNMYGTTFPASPVNGQEFYYVADATNGIVWHFRYNSSAATYKWEYMGGSPLVNQDSSSVALTGDSTVHAFATDFSLTLPRNGEYLVHAETQAGFASGSGVTYEIGLGVNSTTSMNGGYSESSIFGGGAYAPAQITWKDAGNAGQVVHMLYWANYTGFTLFQRSLTITPIRVN